MGPTDRSRLVAGIGSVALNCVLLVALLIGLRVNVAGRHESALAEVAFTPNAPPPREQPKPHIMRVHLHLTASGGARARPRTAIMPRIALMPPTAAVAPKPDSGTGTGLGQGKAGTGGGASEGFGNGDAGEGGGSDAEWISGQINNGDYPRAAANRGAHGTVRTEITVAADGRAAGCQISRSSGDEDLDATTCRLILRRFRFRPATDDAGHPITDTVEYEQEWVLSRAADLPASH